MAPLNPEVRLERFLAGQDLNPAVRLEYFLAGAAGYGLAALQNESAAISAGGAGVANIPDAAGSVPFQSIVTAIDPVQEGTGDPAPDNVRPISGHTGAMLTVTGKNLYSREYSKYNVPVYGTDGSITSYPDVAAFWIKVRPNTTYYVSYNQPTTTFYFRWINCDANKGFISRPGGTYNSDVIPSSFITPANTEWVEIAVNQHEASQIASNSWEVCISETPTDYVPFGSQYHATFGQTVYGGTFDWVSGKLTSKMALIDLGTLNWSYSDSGIFIVLLPGLKYASGGNLPNMLSSIYKTATPNQVYNHTYENSISSGAGNSSVWVYNSSYTDAETFKNAMAGVQLCYELATPIEIDLPDMTILANAGVNNIWSDAGNVLAVEYKQDPEASATEIKALIAPVLPEMKADANLVANDFRIVGNTLYKITANIASGGTLTPGSNCTATTVAAQLKALL